MGVLCDVYGIYTDLMEKLSEFWLIQWINQVFLSEVTNKCRETRQNFLLNYSP